VESKADYEVVKLIDLTDWQARLEERQRREVEFARLYARDFSHGTAGHNRLLLIAGLAGMLDAMAALVQGKPTSQRTLKYVLDIPYHSQHEDDAQRYRRDCGPACIEMVGKFYHPEAIASTDDIMAWITGGADRSTYIAELQHASQHFFGLELERHNEATWEDLQRWIVIEGKPIVGLGHYGSLRTRMDRGWTGGHFFVLVGFDQVNYQGRLIERSIIHDPDYYAGLHAQGAFIPIVRDHFMAFWDDCHKDRNPRRMALVPKV
jgi:hypothetical protein